MAWKKFPHPAKKFTYTGDALAKHWARLHRGDCEPWPENPDVQDAWRLFHAGDFAGAYERGLAAGEGLHRRGRRLVQQPDLDAAAHSPRWPR